MSVSINTTLATLRNVTETSWQQGDATNNYLTTSAARNFTEWTPYFTVWTEQCPQCYPQYSYNTVSYTSTYIYYSILLLLLVVAIICIRLGFQRRRELLLRQAAAQRRAARLQAAYTTVTPNSTSNSNNNNNDHMSPKESDLPPAYDDIIPTNLMAKHAAPCSQEAPQGGSHAVSTLTIATDIPSNFSSDVDLNSITNSTASIANNRCAVIAPPAVPDTRIDITSSVHSNENIV